MPSIGWPISGKAATLIMGVGTTPLPPMWRVVICVTSAPLYTALTAAVNVQAATYAGVFNPIF